MSVEKNKYARSCSWVTSGKSCDVIAMCFSQKEIGDGEEKEMERRRERDRRGEEKEIGGEEKEMGGGKEKQMEGVNMTGGAEKEIGDGKKGMGRKIEEIEKRRKNRGREKVKK